MTRKERLERALAEARAEHDGAPATKLLVARMAYHRAKNAAEERRAERRAA